MDFVSCSFNLAYPITCVLVYDFVVFCKSKQLLSISVLSNLYSYGSPVYFNLKLAEKTVYDCLYDNEVFYYDCFIEEREGGGYRLVELFYSVEELKILDMMAYVTTCTTLINKAEKGLYIFRFGEGN